MITASLQQLILGTIFYSLHAVTSYVIYYSLLGMLVTSATPRWMILTKDFDHLQIKCHPIWRKSLCLLYPSRLVAHLQYLWA